MKYNVSAVIWYGNCLLVDLTASVLWVDGGFWIYEKEHSCSYKGQIYWYTDLKETIETLYSIIDIV